MRRATWGRIWAIVVALHVALAAAQERGPGAPGDGALRTVLERAEALRAAGKAADAYAFLASEEDEHIGEARFDYALGRAALEAGFPARATLAFSRVLAVDPYHAGALIDSGRAYLALGNFDQARATFESLLALDPPPALRAQLQGFLEQARRGVPARPLFAGYLVATAGHSTNVNQSPGQSQVFVPVFNARFDLSAENVRKADGWWSVGGGGEASLPLGRTWSLVGGGELMLRQNLRESAFDLGGIGARVGVAAASGLDLLRLQWITARNYVGHDANREVDALSAEGFKMVGPDDQLLASAQTGRIRYVPAGLTVFDSDFVSLGLGVSHRTDGSSTLGVGLSAGGEHDVGGNPDGNKRQLGLRGSWDRPLAPRWTGSVAIALQQTQYDRINPAFLVERRDRRRDVEVSLQHVLDQSLSLRVGAARTVQRSNIAIQEFERTEVWIMVRRELR